MKVVIVAKTRMGSGACIGGITFDGRSVRLIAANAATNDQFNQEYEVGDVWNVTVSKDQDIIPPHVENVVVHQKHQLPPIDSIIPFIGNHMPPRSGGLEMLYEGLTQSTKAGALFISERTGVPSCSTMFWRPDKPLVRDDDAKRIRYRYPMDDGGRTLTFVGYQEPVPTLPAGTLLRVSLAHWWRPKEMPDGELRCYVQLSGWFSPGVEHSDHFDVEAVKKQPLPPEDDRQIPTGNLPEVLLEEDPQKVLKKVFGYDSFRPLQHEVIQSLLDGRDALAVMPTGSGKSLCYQLPALLSPSLTVVVTPLISLMEDQVMQLREIGIPAVYLNSTLNYRAYTQTVAQIRAGKVRLLYAAPETLLRPETKLLLEQVPVNCMTIDEAHCISEWGHDFRPEYRQLVELRQKIPEATCLAVTATATQHVRQDIKLSLGISAAQEFIASFDRENLFLEVEPRHDTSAQVQTFLEAHRGQAGIIYCATRRKVDSLTAELVKRGWLALPYHAGLDERTRRHNQRQFSRSDDAIMVATIAFGMGINKSNVRFVLHVDSPKNLESYYQQIGRSGRDGLRADCLLLYGRSDLGTIYHFMDQQDQAEQRLARMRLDALIGYAETTTCRRRPLLAYFDEVYQSDNCGMCDNCTTEQPDLEDLTIPAQMFLSCVIRTGQIFGITHIVNVLRGSREKRVLLKGHDRLSTYGIGRYFSAKTWQYLGRQFVQLGLLARDAEHGSLKLTAAGYGALKGEPVWGRMPEERVRQARRLSEVDYDATLFDLLRAKRRELADAGNVPAFVVFSDRSLVEMAAYFPRTEESFGQMYGVGRVKLDKYAADFLPVIRAYCRERGIAEKDKPRSAGSRPRKRSGKRQAEIVEAYNSGRSLPDIAEAEGIKLRTVVGHLWRAVQDGQALRLDDLRRYSQLSPGELEAVAAAFEEHGFERLRPVYDALEGKVSYDELHLLRLHYATQVI